MKDKIKIMADPIEAVVLAGGFGTRLRDVVPNVPKPMAPIDEAGNPFLSYVLAYLVRQGVKCAILSIGYKGDIIQSYFGNSFQGMKLLYSCEDEPLGTGGAAKMALKYCSTREVFVLNGDTFFAVDLMAMRSFHRKQGADFTLAMKEMFNFNRYGALEVKSERIISFKEKQPMQRGWINGGVYCLPRTLLTGVSQNVFSLESDFLESQIKRLKIYGFLSEGYFIDIGTPTDYYMGKTKMGLICSMDNKI